MLTGDEPLVVRRDGKAIRLAKLDPATEGIFIPGNRDLATCHVTATIPATIIAIIAAIAVGCLLLSQNTWWKATECEYSGCTVKDIEMEGSLATIEIMLNRGCVWTQASIRTHVAKAPYFCEMKSGPCYITVVGGGAATNNPSLALVKTHRHSAMFIILAMILAAVATFTATTLGIVAVFYSCEAISAMKQ